MFVLATLELGRIAERLGDTRKAAECYGFVMRPRRPDGSCCPMWRRRGKGWRDSVWVNRCRSGGTELILPPKVQSETKRPVRLHRPLPLLGSNQDSPDPEL